MNMSKEGGILIGNKVELGTRFKVRNEYSVKQINAQRRQNQMQTHQTTITSNREITREFDTIS